MTQYFSDVLGQPTDALEVPDLQAVAKDFNVPSTLIMCRLTLAIAVQCDKNKEFIEKIQGLSEANQHHLMKAIEQVKKNSSQSLMFILDVVVVQVMDRVGPTSSDRSTRERNRTE
jgi:hypothetical protein